MDILNYENVYKSSLLVEQHFHGAFGVDFSTCESDEVLELAKKLLNKGIGGFYPTLVTDSVENIKRQIERIKTAAKNQANDMAQILGIHIEGIFINPNKKGIHDEKLFLKPTVENYKLIEDDFIKIVTLAPELDENSELRRYLTLKGIKVQAGHCIGPDLNGCHGVTHLFNAMEGINHRARSASLSALIDDNIHTEIIADGIHLDEDILELVFKSKPEDKILLVSDSLPLAGIPAPLEGEGKGGGSLIETNFAGEKIFYDGKKATSKNGTIAGSTSFLNEIVKRLSIKDKKHFEKYVKMASDNVQKYHNITLNGCVYWDERFDIIAVEKDSIVLYRD